MKLNLWVFSFFYCLINTAFAQSISNITASQSGKNIAINYALNGIEGITTYEIKLFVSPDGGNTWQGPLTLVTGDVGKGQAAANNKSITWEVLKEPGFVQLKGDNIQFKIKAFYSTIGDIEMVWVEGGSFMMGSNDGQEDEKPVHEVTLNGFYMGKYEVTQAQWQKVMGNNPSKFSGCPKCPVEQVSWNDVQDFIIKLNAQSGKKYRLPTEAEWEYAAKGGKNNSSYRYSGSDNIDEVAWHSSNTNDETHPIGTKKANALGIFDMSGNVSEWCSDWYDKNHYQYSMKNNPKGGLTGDYRVLRGSSFIHNVRYCRLAFRDNIFPNFRYLCTGFRLTQD
jgi:formylglycine-generating enzyme required for sulfatase activity